LRSAHLPIQSSIRVTVTLAALVCAVLSAGVSSARADAPCASPMLTVTSTSSIAIPVGGQSALPPKLSVACGHSPAAGAQVSATLSSSVQLKNSGQLPVQFDLPFTVPPSVNGQQVNGPGKHFTWTFQSGSNGIITLPILDSGLKAGSETLTFSVVSSTGTLSVPLRISVAATGRLNPALNNPRSNLPYVQLPCKGPSDTSAGCLRDSMGLMNTGRRNEHLGPLILPANWARLNVPEQLFVLTDLERTARGIFPYTGLSQAWNAEALAGARRATDPDHAGPVQILRRASPMPGLVIGTYTGEAFSSDWAGGEPNPVAAVWGWVYDDGLGSFNIACSRQDRQGCWGHRDSILTHGIQDACNFACPMGAAYAADDPGKLSPDYTLDVPAEFDGNNGVPQYFTWARDVVPYLPACERSGDSCSWAGQPIGVKQDALTQAAGG